MWRLVDPGQIDAPVIEGVHNHWLCALSVVIAIAAAWVLLPVTSRYHKPGQRYRNLWLVGGSLAMGTGIWAMHFMAMLAYRLPLPVSYDITTTIVSIVPAVLASAYCIITYQPANLFDRRLQRAAISMAVGIGLMHYLGMEAIRLPADMYYSPGLFVLSIVAAYVLALLGLFSYTRAHNLGMGPLPGLALGSVILGMAVSGMHFIAMQATYFVASERELLAQLVIEPYALIWGILLVVIFIVGLTIAGVVVDRRFDRVSSSLQQSEMRFSQLAANTQMAIFTFDEQQVIYANPALSTMLGFSAEQIEHLPLPTLFGEAFQHLAHDVLTPPLLFDKAFHEEFKIITQQGETKWIYLSVTLTQFNNRYLGLASGFDISSQKRAEYSLRELAYHDQLTHLANRTMFIDRLDHHLKLLARRDGTLDSCVMLLDLDGFKGVNDSLGHQAGDKLLSIVAGRLTRVSRESDTVARLGGDEFVMLFEHLGETVDWSLLADKLLQQFEQPFVLNNRSVEVGASIGVLPLGQSHYDNPDDVLRDVDIALYRAKHYKNSRWVIFDEQLDLASRRTRTLHAELKAAIKADELLLYFQPIVNVDANAVEGFEALARWQRSNGEWVSPGEFIPLAERAGMISDISRWALRTAARQVDQWRQSAGKPLYISINVAAESFRDEHFLNDLQDIISTYAIAPGEIKLELTESMLMKNAESMLRRLDELTALGFSLMLDDFGTGYSSLAALNQLPISTVKIDQSFVADLDARDQSGAVIKTIISLARQLDMSVISEGVETLEQAQRLRRLGCHVMQGYWFGRPTPAAEAQAFFATRFADVNV